MTSTHGSRKFSHARNTRFDRGYTQRRNDSYSYSDNERNNGNISRNQPSSLQFTTDINPAIFSGPIPFSIPGAPDIPAATFQTRDTFGASAVSSDYHLENRLLRRNDTSQNSAKGDRRYHKYRDSERDREHLRDRDKNRERDRSCNRTVDRSLARTERDRDRVKERDIRDEIPNNTIMVRSLNSSVTEADLRSEVIKYGLEPKDIRLIREKDTGTSRGFAFVEFSLLSEAVRWKELTEGVIFVDSQHRSTLHYSIPKDAVGAEKILNRADWGCSKCGMTNFRRRSYCYKCNSPREDVDNMRSTDGHSELSSYPSNTLLFRNLDVLTTEARVLAMLGQLTSLPIKSLRVAKDTLTKASKGFAVVELHSTSEATQLHDLLSSMNNNFYVDGRQITVSYVKQSLSSVNSAASANAAVVALAAAQWSNQESDSCLSSSCSKVPSSTENLNTQDTVQTLGAVPTTASATDLGTVIVKGVTYKKYPMPDISTYQYDDSSGYYYDASTGLYYDASSQYYYNSELQHYLYWDSNQETYLPAVPSTDDSVTASSPAGAESQNQEKGKVKKEEKLDKVKIAKKIVKDMERWGKTTQKKKIAKLGIVPSPSLEPAFVVPTAKNITRPSAAADAGFAILQKKTTLSVRNSYEVTVTDNLNISISAERKMSTLVAQYGDDSDAESDQESAQAEVQQNQKSDIIDESKFIDLNKLACLLCKRQFPTKEILLKHQQLSDLHKQNRSKLLVARKNRL